MQTKASAPALNAGPSASGRTLRIITLGEQPSPRRANNRAAAGRPGSSQSIKTRSGLNSLTCTANPSTSALSRTMTSPGSCLSSVCSAERTRASLSATRIRVYEFPPTRHLPFTDAQPCQISITQVPTTHIRHSYSLLPVRTSRSGPGRTSSLACSSAQDSCTLTAQA